MGVKSRHTEKNMRRNRKIEGGMSLLLRLNVQNNLTWRRAERTKTTDQEDAMNREQP